MRRCLSSNWRCERHTAFDCMRLLECGGDVGAAVGEALSLLQLEM
nr:MAG TPA: hypothetical protein [Caudoviricetes sp.]